MLTVQIAKSLSVRGISNFELRIREEFPAGFTVLFGPSGAGKSTLLDCIAGLTRPDEGRIALGEKTLFYREQGVNLEPQRRDIGYVFQSLALFPHLSAEENIGYGISHVSSAEREAKIAQIASTFHIQKLRGRKPGELSGGEKQRVALARSLVTRPRLLLLDEPLTGLDKGLRTAILEDLREWNAEQRIPILYVTHNREEADAIGDRMIAMVDGHVRDRGMPSDVMDAPRATALALAVGFENVLPARVLEHRQGDGVMRVALDGGACELEVPLGTQQVGDEIRVAIRAGDVLLATQLPYGLSARNVLPGRVESLEARGTLVNVVVNVGVRVMVHVTPGAARSLELAPESVVWLVLKTHSCHVVA